MIQALMTNHNSLEQPLTSSTLASLPMLKKAICLLQNYVAHLGYQAQIHFELEGCYRIDNTHSHIKKLDFKAINQHLRSLNIDGEIVSEYWRNQWEYVSLFNGQTPLKEAMNLHQAITQLPQMFQKHYGNDGLVDTLITPVVWSGDQGKLAHGSKQIFTHDRRAVHIPNAVQLNVSVLDSKGDNLIAKEGFGEYLQSCFLRTSLDCCLLYLPEEAAFERLALKSRYGLSQELCSPVDISGGHQGSVALYKELGKHNQNMGEEPLLYDKDNKVLSVQQNWQKTARIEHRLGASSIYYNPYVNVLYGLLNVVDAIEAFEENQHLSTPEFVPKSLPQSLISNEQSTNAIGAIDLFKASSWFSRRLNAVQENLIALKLNNPLDCPMKLGDKIKQMILDNYQVNLTIQ
jgi:hypothetical protein